MAKKKKSTDYLEDPQIVAEKLEGVEHWVERNKKVVLGSVVVIFLIIGGYMGFRYYIHQQETIAQQEMFQAVYYFEADSLRLALEGDGNNLGFTQIIDDYSMTETANLAQYYAGVINLKQNDFLLAIDHFKDFSTDDVLLQARGYSLIGDAYMELKQYEDAVNYYRKAVLAKPNKFFTPAYMLKEAFALEKLGQKHDAIEVYQKIIADYWDSSESSQAKKFMARLHTDS